ncbi:glycoside hydrolase family 6 protein [Leifsonia sp. fls2-241-R2A-40a]|uniref:glycoside hydrolase family 6 protein n=1 Tax=Leifsonia sp. fls2-241-R2A-40a TaxID=3040290 RepID=UPI00254BBFA2|nr:glycoside hydrolase family 6 protein [Leifsonia sp. fls2-241-R2A-40a]
MRRPLVVALLAVAVVLVAVGVAFAVTAGGRTGTAPAAAGTSATASPGGTATAAAGPRSPAFASTRLYLDPNTEAAAAEKRFSSDGDPAAASFAGRIAEVPTAVWLGEWFQGDRLSTELRNDIADARSQKATPVFVAYAIPNRDCGGYSKGGLAADQYLPWIRSIASTLRGSDAVMLLEPDSLAMLSEPQCDGTAATRLPLLRSSVRILESAGVSTYLDGGNGRWLSATQQASWLTQAGVKDAHGFFTNVSNFDTTQHERDYAGRLSSKVGWKHYVIDVSRNGKGWTGTWCNPPGAALGENPKVTEGSGSKLDALLWVKHPGVSDGSCNGGPAAGVWWQAGAEALVHGKEG